MDTVPQSITFFFCLFSSFVCAQCLTPAQRDADAASQQQCARSVNKHCVYYFAVALIARDAFSPYPLRATSAEQRGGRMESVIKHQGISSLFSSKVTLFLWSAQHRIFPPSTNSPPTAAFSPQFNQVAVSSADRASPVASAAARSLRGYAARARSFHRAGEPPHLDYYWIFNRLQCLSGNVCCWHSDPEFRSHVLSMCWLP